MTSKSSMSSASTLEKKLESLSKELEQEKDHEKQQEILKSINSLLETIEKSIFYETEKKKYCQIIDNKDKEIKSLNETN